MRVSIRDVARQVGVSHVTVANVLNGRPFKASPETTELVLQAAREMNYIPIAQPATQRRHVETRIIGLVFDHLRWDDYWGLEIYRGLQFAAQEYGYDLLTISKRPKSNGLDRERLSFLDRRTDGFIFFVPEDRDEIFETLIDQNIPVVSCSINKESSGVASVVLDNYGAMALAVEHQADLNHKRLLFIGPQGERADFADRLEGFRIAMRARHLEPHSFLVDPEVDWTESATEELKRLSITGIVFASDGLAVRLHQALTAQGWRIPEDISMTGMDNSPGIANYGLTTIGYSCHELGKGAIENIVHAIKEGKTTPHCDIVPVELVQRSSTASPKQEN